ncbi:uncharacterized protein T551_02633 [Pneumocystis jirovecii RU7]|uniref:PRA1 family protein n=1 Tax=Pneumocystis jirovecii (strain RU7) TaxID=1408657 RepID=A0A0W4ZIL4_PNEJ7|nr:uncharacterized protein T551_02633 [Pneumocystis jirovecii RU7]KTW28214.1 hypothetical protein T551_02633 [Pneumocystis jirovecii RU7]
MNVFKDHIRSLQNFHNERFINLHSFKEFLDFRRLAWPRDIIDVQQRMRCNLSRFSSNYAICFGLIVLYFLLTNPLLLFVLLFTTGGFFGISRLNGQNLHIGHIFFLVPCFSITFKALLIITIPLGFIASPISTILSIIGASSIIIMSHSILLEPPITCTFEDGDA